MFTQRVLIYVCFIAGLSLTAFAQSEWTVDDDGGKDFTEIQDAILDENVESGDTILVYPGTYDLINIDKDLIIKSINPDNWQTVLDTIIDGGNSGDPNHYEDQQNPITKSAVTIDSQCGVDGECKLEGFTIRGGFAIDPEDRYTEKSANSGGGICGNGAFATISKCYIHHNRATFNGGGIWGIQSKWDSVNEEIRGGLADCRVAENVAWSQNDSSFHGYGGGISSRNGYNPFSTYIYRCTIKSNKAARYGGGICESKDVKEGNKRVGGIENCLIIDNQAMNCGGGIYECDFVDLCEIKGNKTTTPFELGSHSCGQSRGGGVYNSNVRRSLIQGNTATYTGLALGSSASENCEGGGVCIFGMKNYSLENCRIIRNTTKSSGGGIWGGKIYNCLIENNEAVNNDDPELSTDGGGACFSTLYFCDVFNNEADYGGGCKECNGYSSYIYGNKAHVAGGGIYSAGDKYERCHISGNIAMQHGGGISGIVQLNSCLIVGNRATENGGGYCGYFYHQETDKWLLSGVMNGYNCTIADNEAEIGGGYYTSWDNVIQGHSKNFVVYGNTPDDYVDMDPLKDTFTYSCYPNPTGMTNISDPPSFVGRGYWTGTGEDAYWIEGDYHLVPSLFSATPCIDDGTNTGVPERDLDSFSRIWPENGTTDRGCYEYREAGLVAHWKLDIDEEWYGPIIDETDNNFIGYGKNFQTSPAYPADGKDGTALEFDGIDDYVQLLDPDGVEASYWEFRGIGETNARTVCAWIKTYASGGESRTILHWGGNQLDEDLEGDLWWLYVDPAGKVVLDLDGGTVESQTTIPVNEWHHVAVVLEPGVSVSCDIKMYIDGHLDGQATGQCEINTVTRLGMPIYIGARCSNSFQKWSSEDEEQFLSCYFDGVMDDVRIYNKALRIDEIHELPGRPESTLEAYWKLDENSGLNASDSSGNGNDGTLQGYVIWMPGWIPGRINNCLAFDGVDDYVETSYILNPNAGSFSVFAWVKGGAAYDGIISQAEGSGGTARYWLHINSNGYLSTQLRPSSGGVGLIYEENWDSISWHHVGMVWDGERRYLYLDGVKRAWDEDPIDPLESCTGGMLIGTNKLHSDNFWQGLIDEVRIYSRALSEEEISGMAQVPEMKCIYNVTQDLWYPSIQDACSEAEPGDEIEVYPGTYYEHIIIDVPITLRSTDPNDSAVVASTIIDGYDRGCTVTIAQECTCILEGLTITGGFLSSGHGAGIRGNGNIGLIRNCIVRDNHAVGGSGGGLHSYNGTISHCEFFNNSSSGLGGAMAGVLEATLKNCILHSNQASYGGAINNIGNSGTGGVFNCTVTNNVATIAGGGIRCLNDDYQPIVVNSVLWGNTDGDSNTTVTQEQIYSPDPGFSPAVTFNCIQDDDPDDAYIPFGGSLNGNIDDNPDFIDDYHLGIDSPCVDAGNNTGVHWDTDIDGQVRIAGIVDMGADELVRVYNITRNLGYLSIQSAIDNALDEDEIVVYPGTYHENVNFNGKNITVRSMNLLDWDNVEDTIIEGTGATNVIEMTPPANQSVLKGLTITGGKCGVYCHSGSYPEISHCIIRDNTQTGVLLQYCGATIKNCVIAFNGDEGVSIASASSTLKNNIIHNQDVGIEINLYASSTIYNCTIADNTYGIARPPMYANAMIKNCILWNDSDDLENCTATYSCVKENGDDDPQLDSSYHITSSSSPCVDAGDNSIVDWDYDMDSQDRVMDGDGDQTATVDMGADEYMP